MAESTLPPDDRLQLQCRVAELEAENARLRDQADHVAEANVRAAMQLIDVHADRERSLQIKNREIEAALQKAEDASRLKSRFLANMSHELRTPLAGIRGMADLLREGPLHPAQRDYADAIARTADSFLQIVNELLDFAKIEAGRLEIEHIEFDLWELVEDIAQHLQVTAGHKQLRFLFELGADVPRRIRGDSLRLRQVLHNLGSNAVKFTNAGSVRLGVTRGGSIEAPVLEVAVADTGCGISEAAASRLFEPFVQADASTTRRFGGTGLGLVICKHLAQRMGGELTFVSTPDVGTTFTLRLPVDAVAVATPPRTDKGRAVVIGNEPSIATTLRQHLDAAGYTVTVGADLAAVPIDGDLLVVDCAGDGNPERVRLEARGERRVPTVLLVDVGAAAEHADVVGLALLERPLRPSRLTAAIAHARGPAGGPVRVVEPCGELAGMRVLVAEDTPVNRRVVVAQLMRMGVEVASVGDGEAAVAAVGVDDFDLVLMDCHMPELDGYAATAAIRRIEQGRGRHTPIVALTANLVPGHKEQCLAAGMDDHLVKPVRKAELEAVLRRYRRR